MVPYSARGTAYYCKKGSPLNTHELAKGPFLLLLLLLLLFLCAIYSTINFHFAAKLHTLLPTVPHFAVLFLLLKAKHTSTLLGSAQLTTSFLRNHLPHLLHFSAFFFLSFLLLSRALRRRRKKWELKYGGVGGSHPSSFSSPRESDCYTCLATTALPPP